MSPSSLRFTFSIATIKNLVAEILGGSVDELDDDENLISLGLDSMGLIKVAAAWREQTGQLVLFADLAKNPTFTAWKKILIEDSNDISEVLEKEDDEPHSESFPLATMQHAYWVGRSESQELGGVAAHLYVEFDGALEDVAQLSSAVTALVHRHPSLRTKINPDGTQEVLDEPPKEVFSVVDLRDSHDVQSDLEQLRDARSHQRLDVEAGQVIDISLSLLPDEVTRLHVDVDMIAADAMSYRTIMSDLADLYEGTEVSPVSFDYDYRTYLQDHDHSTREQRAQEQSWWAERIIDYPEPPALPLISETSMVEPHRSNRLDHYLNPRKKKSLYEKAKQHGVTPAMVLASCFADVIARWSGTQRFLLNIPLFDREPLHTDVEKLVGDFSNSILLDVTVDPAASFIERVRSMQENLHTHAAHSAYRGLDVLRDLGRLAGSPVIAPVVYTSGLNLGELFSEEVTRVFGRPVWIISQGPQVVLDAQVVEIDGGILFNWDVRSDAFPLGLIETMFEAYRSLIEALLDDKTDWSDTIDIPLPESQTQIRQLVNDTSQEFTERTLHLEFFRRSLQNPEHPAVLWGKNSKLSYGELADAALRVATALLEVGVQRGDTVAIHIRKGYRQIPAVLGVLAAGATYLPIGEDQPATRRNTILHRSNTKAVLIDRDIDDLRDGVTPLMIDTAMHHPKPISEPITVSPSDIAYVLFTSGSTGEPKGVEIPHKSAANTIDGVISVFDLTSNDRAIAISVLEFDPSVIDIFGSLYLGGAVIAIESDQAKDALSWAELACRYRASVITCAPGILRMLLEVATADQLKHLHAVMLGGDWVTKDLPRDLHRLAPQARFAGLGGTTETSIHCTVCEVEQEIPDEWDAVPYGVPLPNFKCRVVNEAGQDSPDFVAGELWVGGPSVGAGYRGDPERTADRFLELNGHRWYRTGDLARYLPDGCIEFLGRADHQVKVRGYRIELGEVEAALRAVKGIEIALVEVVGTKAPRLVGVVSGAVELDGENIRKKLTKLLPKYMIPERIDVLEQIPLTTNGKLDRIGVRNRLESNTVHKSSTQPADSLEAALLHIVDGVLPSGLDDVEDDFFALGGDSILATSAIARIRALLQVTTVTAADVFRARTVRDLASLLRSREDTAGQLKTVADIYLEISEVSVSSSSTDSR